MHLWVTPNLLPRTPWSVAIPPIQPDAKQAKPSAKTEVAGPCVMAWPINEALKENKNQTSPPSPSFSCTPYGENKSRKKGWNVKSADCSEQHVWGHIFNFHPGKKQEKRKTRLLVEIPKELLLCLCSEGSGNPISALPAKHPYWVLLPVPCLGWGWDGCVCGCRLGKPHIKHQNDVSSSICIFFALF